MFILNKKKMYDLEIEKEILTNFHKMSLCQ